MRVFSDVKAESFSRFELGGRFGWSVTRRRRPQVGGGRSPERRARSLCVNCRIVFLRHRRRGETYDDGRNDAFKRSNRPRGTVGASLFARLDLASNVEISVSMWVQQKLELELEMRRKFPPAGKRKRRKNKTKNGEKD